ncbi:Nucleoside diphosphate kinase B [Porites harrisoni]
MAFRSKVSPFVRSSLSLFRSPIVRRTLTSQSKESASYFRFAGPFVIGATAAGAGLFAASRLYNNNFTFFENVHAATKVENKPDKTERTFIMVKPDGVQRGLIGDIIKRFEQKGFKLVAMKFMQASEEHLRQHYADLSNLPFFPGLVKHMASGPVVAMVWEGLGVVKTGRVMLGETDPAKSKPGTIRGDYCIEIGRNIIHGSDSVESAEKEIALWFSKKEELVDWTPAAYKYVYEK